MFQFVEIAKCGFKYSNSLESKEIDKKTFDCALENAYNILSLKADSIYKIFNL